MFYAKAGLPPLLLLALVGCGGAREQAAKDREDPPMIVSTIPVTTSEWKETYEAVGTVRARMATTISSRVMAYVREVKAQTGDRVAAGQVLVVLDARDVDVALRQANSALAEARSAVPESDGAIATAAAQLELAETTLRRMRELLEKRSVSQQEYDEAAARVKVAQAGRNMAEARRRQLSEKIHQAEQAVEQAAVTRDYTEIKAPFAARVTARRAEPGTVASPGAPLLDIEQEGSYRLEVSVEESRLGTIRRGDTVAVALDALEHPLAGGVSEIVPAVDAASRAFLVKIDLPRQATLRGGLFGRARFPAGTRRAIAIPRNSVIAQGQVQSVMVADAGRARARLVTVGAANGDSVEVLSGLREGDKLVYPVPAGLRDGARVEVR